VRGAEAMIAMGAVAGYLERNGTVLSAREAQIDGV